MGGRAAAGLGRQRPRLFGRPARWHGGCVRLHRGAWTERVKLVAATKACLAWMLPHAGTLFCYDLCTAGSHQKVLLARCTCRLMLPS